ncbi:MAG: FAD-dependent oxidoreductase [Acidobacteriota bacterium]|nr:FAD-dependent oxidoreductase [Acidobacteriota bacterium]
MRRGRLSADFDLAIVGSGFAGSLLACIARRLGLTAVLVEKESHPRFAIGESSSPLANVILDQLAARYDLDWLRPFSAWGTWRSAHPGIDCGLKRGFTFYGHRAGEPFRADPKRRNELLVAASPRDAIADTQWNRAEFDAFLAGRARACGADLLERTVLESFRGEGSSVRLEGKRGASDLRLRVRLVVDASGPRGFLSRALGIADAGFESLRASSALYSHFEGVRRLDGLPGFTGGETPPYPIDAAAVHHVLEGGWIWVLRFQSGLVSAGASAKPALAARLRLEEGEPAWRRLLAELPTVAEQFAGSAAIRPFTFAPGMPFRSAAASGPGWAMLPSAAAFVDPMLSTGIPLALLGVERIARGLRDSWGSSGLAAAIGDCGTEALEEADRTALLVSALSAAYGDFELFSRLTLLYFAAASHAEVRRRLDPEARTSFLMGRHARFGPALERICRSVMRASRAGTLPGERETLMDDVLEAIEPLDIAGLSDAGRLNWHPVEAGPLLAGAAKVGAGRRQIEEMLERTGFNGTPGVPAEAGAIS